ncbi:LpqB family beta-propeller domain-containing protein [Georgenia sp. SYP-B2076]|uniref:LpqB family beta-propeller domain-containing protein n=1 Tax=Georgenia sp. SYP-B2076 TaxID=2495881 RepID=UPI000F8C854F|nr:LpqB family beta-propeller domain-containing protein [Georgenia sp. SYP-B2076]
MSTPPNAPAITRHARTDSPSPDGRPPAPGMTRLRTRLLRAVVALAAALVLAGCASLPRSGPVTASEPDLPASQGIGLFARGPEADASPQDIVDGFLTASAAGYSDEFLVARQFLAGTAVSTWQPLEQVRIYSDSQPPAYSRAPDGGVRLSVPAQASVDSDGLYTESAPQTMIQTDFTLARNADGEWRIIELDDGVLLLAANFSSVYAQGALYFLTPDLEALVPDVRWYPRHNLATALVRGLLNGPAPWLEPGVTTMVPAGTRMTVESVAVSERVAQVDLSADSLAADPEQRVLLYAQIERTLRGVGGVQQVQITAANAPFEITGDIPDLSAYPYTASNLVVISDGALADVVGGDLAPRAGAQQMAGMDPRHPALGYEGTASTTVLLDGPDRLVTAPEGDAQPFLLAQGTSLVAPSVDRQGWVWTTPAASNGHLTAVRPDGTRADVSAPWLDGGTVRSIRISREGARAVIVWQSAGTTVVDVATVVRGLDGTPRGLGEPARIGDRLTDATQAVWVDEQTVAALGTSGGDPAPTVHLIPLGGPTSLLPAVDGTVSITAGRGDRSIVLGTESGRLYERNGAAWRPVLGNVYDPALPG